MNEDLDLHEDLNLPRCKWVTTLQPPMVRTVQFERTSGAGLTYKYRLPLPWVVYLTHFTHFIQQGKPSSIVDGVYAAFCNEKPVDSSIVYHIPLPNVYGKWKLCISDLPRRERLSVDACVQYWWSSLFSKPHLASWEGTKVIRRLFPNIEFTELLSKWSEMTVEQFMGVDITGLCGRVQDTTYNMTYEKFNSFIKMNIYD